MAAKCPQCKGPTAARGLTCSSCVGGAHGRRRLAAERLAAPSAETEALAVQCAKEAEENMTPASLADSGVYAGVAPIVGFKDDGLGPGNAGEMKPRPELLPAGPMIWVSRVIAWGAHKYTRNGQDGAGNWMHVVNGRMRYLGACMRHLFAYMAGQRVDEESQLPTLAHAATDLLFAFWHDLAEQEAAEKDKQ